MCNFSKPKWILLGAEAKKARRSFSKCQLLLCFYILESFVDHYKHE